MASHQTGHNSGVIHAGVYYKPGSLKADFCKRGAELTVQFCQEHGIAYEQCGKMLVATTQVEYDRMNDLELRCEENGISTQAISQEELMRREPAITGMGALFVPATGITDYRQISSRMAELFVELGGHILTGQEVKAIQESSSNITLSLPRQTIRTSYLLACAGLQADRIARMTGIRTDFAIIPFRGEYYLLPPCHNTIVKHLIYPVPDPKLPFLGVHLTRMIDGTVTVGPNAVPGYKREGYGALNFSLKDTLAMLAFPGFWKVIAAHLRSGIAETRDSWYKPGYLKRVQKYCPQIQLADLTRYPTGIRAQAVMADGCLVHDFLFRETARSFHVCNAPSPAATSAIPIGKYICGTIENRFAL